MKTYYTVEQIEGKWHVVPFQGPSVSDPNAFDTAPPKDRRSVKVFNSVESAQNALIQLVETQLKEAQTRFASAESNFVLAKAQMSLAQYDVFDAEAELLRINAIVNVASLIK